MKSLWRWQMVSVVLFCGVAIAGCASTGSRTHQARPLQESKLTIEEARTIVAGSGSHIREIVWIDEGGHGKGVVVIVRPSMVELRTTEIVPSLSNYRGGTFTVSIPLTAPQLDIKIIKYDDSTGVIIEAPKVAIWLDTDTTAQRFGDALQALRDYVAKGQFIGQNESDGFAKVVARYQNANPNPALSEEVRKLKVQAEFALEKKRYAQAIDHYEEALNIAPWWADGHFNRALLLGEAENYPDAVSEMKKYLALEPNAKDARAAQDKLYQWEDEAKTAKIRVTINDRAPEVH